MQVTPEIGLAEGSAERELGVTRTHRTIPHPSPQSHVPQPRSPAACGSCSSLFELSGQALQVQLEASGFMLGPSVLTPPGFWWG